MDDTCNHLTLEYLFIFFVIVLFLCCPYADSFTVFLEVSDQFSILWLYSATAMQPQIDISLLLKKSRSPSVKNICLGNTYSFSHFWIADLPAVLLVALLCCPPCLPCLAVLPLAQPCTATPPSRSQKCAAADLVFGDIITAVTKRDRSFNNMEDNKNTKLLTFS